MIEEVEFGGTSGSKVRALTITNANGARAKLISFGARLTELWMPDRDGKLDDIVLGFDSLPEYEETETYFGATCGRYGNRISKGRFTLEGQNYQLDTNEGGNHLHGGKLGFDRKNWKASYEPGGQSIVFTAVSDDGEMGFPGRADLRAIYELDDDNRLLITMEATTNKTTLMNMVHHSYFNLAGQGSGDILKHELVLAADFYTPVDRELLATGEVLSVESTPFDFRSPKRIGADIDKLGAIGAGVFEEGGGYDHNWCLSGAGTEMRDCADAYDPQSGRRMTLRTTEPGVQFYTGGYLSENVRGKHGKNLCKYAGFTLETQKFPGTPEFVHFPDCVLKPGETYRQRMEFQFSTKAKS